MEMTQAAHQDSPPPLWPDILLPKGFSTERSAQTLKITHRWFSAKYIGVAIIGLIWNTSLFFFLP